MPTPHEAVAAVPPNGGADVNKDLLRGVMVGRTPYALLTDDPTDFTAVDPDTGDVPPTLLYNNAVFWYDAADATTVHDGTTTLVSVEGKRFKIETTDQVVDAVLSQGDVTPPGSPALGDAYIVGAGATGAWSGRDDDIALFTARSWVFLAPRTGRPIYVEDIVGFVHYNAGGSWEVGLGASAIGPASIAASNMVKGGAELIWSVENQTTDTPPGSPTAGVAYIVGPAPTGVWAGQATKLAQYLNGAWVITAPGQGWYVYEKGLKEFRVYDTTDGWVRVNEGLIKISTTVVTVAQSQIDIALTAGFSGFKLVLENVAPVSNAQDLRLLFSNDGGATFENSTYYYNLDGTLNSNKARISISDPMDNVSDLGVFGEVTIFSPADVNKYTSVISHVGGWASPTNLVRNICTAARKVLEAHDYIRFFFNTGNIDAGARVTLYGLI